jgi:predicted ATPase/DNA-binding winged helix-turn-helix (wHTH) protein
VPAASEPLATVDGEPAIAFGPFRLLSAQRLLLEGDRPVRLGSRAFDILTVFAERAGEVIGRDELIARAWPQTFVEESNLKIQVSALRRALGDGQGGQRYIVTVPGRGYNFVAPVRLERAPQASPPPTTAPAATEVYNHNLPYAITRMIGREDAVRAIMSRLSRERLVTVVGPGGIGKTTVALAVAEQMIPAYEDGVWLVDLAPLNHPRLVVSTVAAVLGLEIHAEDPLPGLVAALRDRRMLLLLDNCEHVIDAVVNLAAAVLGGAPGVRILATSREPLGVEGEQVHRLTPLSSPQSFVTPTAAEAAGFTAIQLFVERATAVVEDFALTDANAPLVAEICQRLDGLPLAIEFAAPRVGVLGIDGLAAHLGGNLPQLRAYRRASSPRHRTMRSVVDWSYSLLATDEQNFFRSLGIFAGGFTIEAAAAVAMGPVTTHAEAIDRLADLVTKSLIVADVSGAQPRFRLLDTTRAYALEMLDASDERERLAHRHAEYYRNHFERAEAEAVARPTGEWLADYAREIDDLRAALNWAFSPRGDASLGVALTGVSVPLWTHLSLLEECRNCVERALSAVESGVHGEVATVMKLHAALALSVMSTRGVGAETGSIWTTALELAEELSDSEYQLRSLWGLWLFHRARGQHATALELAQRFCAVADTRPESNDRLIGERMVGESLHYLGFHGRAWRHLERVINDDVGRDHGSSASRFLFDSRASARISQARILWLQGYPDRAMSTVATSIEDARAAQHAISLCYALAHAACPIALWAGNEAAAAKYISMLTDHATDRALPNWHALGRCYEGVLALRRGDFSASLQSLYEGLDALEATTPGLHYGMVLGSLALSLGLAGQVAEGIVKIDEVIARAERTGEHWLTAELLRIKGELSLLQGSTAVEPAELLFRDALNRARDQAALSWELRAATSLARLLRSQSRSTDALAVLQPVYDRFTEGFDTADLVAAKGLLQELRTGSP